MATPLRSSPVLIMSVVGSWSSAGHRSATRGPAVWVVGLRDCKPRADGVADLRLGPRWAIAGSFVDVSCPNDDDLIWEPGQPFHPAGRCIEDDEILDPDAGFAFEVDPGLDGEHRWRREWHVERGTAQ